MSEDPERKRRRLEGPTNSASVMAPLACIAILPDAVLQHCFSFIGPGHYRYIAGTSSRFQELYSSEHESKTTWSAAALSILRAELCLKDVRQKADEEGDDDALLNISLMAASMGNVEVLKWARSKGCVFNLDHFRVAASNGHVCVLEFAETNNLGERYSEEVLDAAAAGGHIPIFEWVETAGRVIPTPASHEAAANGHVELLRWMHERHLLGSKKNMYHHASRGGQIEVLDWLSADGYAIDRDSVILGGVANGQIKPLIWARDHGIRWDNPTTCAYAALFGRLPMLQWLRENDCPWDAGTIVAARNLRHTEIVEWAIANGCPRPADGEE